MVSRMINDKNILAFDTALTGCNVAFMSAEGHCITKQIETQRDQAKLLVPMIQEILDEAEIEFKDVDVIASTNGPGSFTGLRLGLATARALGMALSKPVVGVNTFDFMLAHYRSTGVTGALLIVLETKRQDFYAQSFDEQDVALSDMMATSPEKILNSVDISVVKLGGDCLERFVSVAERGGLTLLDNVTQPDPILLCEIVSKRSFPSSSLVDNRRVEPIYLRGADVSKPKNKPRVLRTL